MILYYNPDVGSGLEYVGNIIKSWIDEIQVPYIEVKDQDHPLHLIQNHFNKIKPDVLIINEEHENICIAVCFYKLFHPDTKIIYIYHVWQNIVYMHTHHKYENKYKQELLEYVDNIICVNWPPNHKDIPEHIRNKMYKGFMPMDPSIYYPKVPWQDRLGLFMYLGNIIHHKMSVGFLQKVQNTNISVDCYGKLSDDPEYTKLFQSCKNVVHKGYVDQSKVADVMNQYKFFVMPHDGAEPFNISLLQSIMCGTIPLVVNDRNDKSITPTWINWAKDLYFENNTVDEFLENLVRTDSNNDLSNASEISTRISCLAMSRFDYQKMKQDIQKIIIDKCSSV
jgi:glycosyltransferase involved in cell wall biosynthesis